MYSKGSETDNQKYFRDETVIIELIDPVIEPLNPLFPMPQKDMDRINDYIVTGKHEDEVVHEWTKLYYHRIWDSPNSQIEYVIEKLKLDEIRTEAQISMWDKNLDQNQEVSPCTQIIWCQKKHGALEMHVHAHSSDGYNKLLMNINEFVALQHYIADRLNLKVGKYLHFVDSCHIKYKNKPELDELFTELA